MRSRNMPPTPRPPADPNAPKKFPVLGLVLLIGGTGALYWWATSTKKSISTGDDAGPAPLYMVPAGFLPRDTLVGVNREALR